MDSLEHLSPSAVAHLSPVVGPQKAGAKRFWTTRELEILKENYPKVGIHGCLALLPGRSGGAIYLKASKLKVKSALVSTPKYKRWKHDPHIDEAIRRGYAAPEGRSWVKNIARIVGRPPEYIKRRALDLGLTTTRVKEPDWTKAEEDFVAAIAHLHPVQIQRRMKAASLPHRTKTAIKIKIRRLNACTIDPFHYTARGLAELFGVNAKVITGWIEKGLLHATRRGTDRTEAQGDMWWIHRRSVRRFVVENAAVIDIRKVEKHWFIDLLANSIANKAES